MFLTTAMMCMALNIYHESRSEPLTGQHAIAQVTFNRAGRDPNKVCDVVFKPRQFSWANPLTTVGKRERERLATKFVPRENKAWELAKVVAKMTIEGQVQDFTQGATHFHVVNIRPFWSHSYERIRLVGAGRHLFYRSV